MDKPGTSYDFPDRLLASLIDQNHPAYEEARGLYNAMIDKRPRWIVPCAEVADVVAAVNHAREKHLLLAIRGGGHNGPGFGSCDGGMVIDMSPMKRVDIDPRTRTVRVEAGCTQGDVDRATSAHGLAVPAGLVSTTGIAGLTLGGGTGHLTRKHGLTIDNLLAAEVVLADGSVVTASEDEHPELFWALRGGGGNFGVVTRFSFQAHPAKDVYAGPIFFDIEHAAEIMRWYRDFLPGASRELGMFFGIKTVPSCDPFPREIWGRRICALISCYNGAEEDGIRAMQPVRDALPKPLMDGMMQMPFVDLQALFDPLLPKGLQWYWKGDYVDELSDAAIAAHAEHGSKTPSELSLMHLYPIDGAVQEVAPDATAWGARRARWSMVIAGIDPDPTKAPELRRWASEYWAAVHKHNPHGGAYINFMMDDEGEARVRAAYGANYERLVAVKRKYDPANLFRVNHNIRP
ncbi:FAD-binding oxidoreductase [Mesorhizobium sp.]|uniref:FAD-binding oxidoreductase n=1 Tax=Mesorhizobium sp. TaxID=1871066 RepID=UPI000FE84418|nr:FAD-binding oxidoreductase [Mesorhizobium sp.]RWK59723.1 MAG: FAD-binding oxidoreductase [Mesorhizobium sp.]RWM44218.1 MAG: FAD-binding oxidoreductase [Mesorhizobium sp.]RWM49574.1 MAG: FAD-binding oxidoreductase [Mesorhizobium sp.]RWM61512.1 MAG: FAD-binding oxidoreductase [Mesorhizobium sp.]RWN02902.1 MAG: FAD-binding oxidoreductase [Mesorhizobium sp.]